MASRRNIFSILAAVFLICGSAQAQKRKGKTVKKKKPSVSQTMTNSPGGIQAVGNVTINQQPPARTFTADQRARLLAELSSKPKGSFEIDWLANDPEGASFAQEIKEVLEAAGWECEGRAVSTYADIKIGIQIQVHSLGAAPVRAIALQQAFRAIDIQAYGFDESRIKDGHIRVTIGKHP